MLLLILKLLSVLVDIDMLLILIDPVVLMLVKGSRLMLALEGWIRVKGLAWIERHWSIARHLSSTQSMSTYNREIGM